MKKNETEKYYYDVADDLKQNCWLNFIVGGRNRGKTYSTLKYCVQNNICFGFIKRTNEDVKLLCTNKNNMNFSPFNALNRDMGWDIRPEALMEDKIGAFYSYEDGERQDDPVGFILSMNAVNKIKGFEFPKMIKILIFDEYIQQPWERVNRDEGTALMDLYKTVDRDRRHRGFPPLILICLANAVRLANPIHNFYEVTDDFAEMQMRGIEQRVIKERGFFLHRVKSSKAFEEKEMDDIVYRAMKDTPWGQMAYGNTFGYDDVSNVNRISLKGFKPVVSIHYKKRDYFIYMKEGVYQVCSSRNTQAKMYNLNRENEQKAFFHDYILDLREACIEDKMHFETYSMYDLITNYKKIFDV